MKGTDLTTPKFIMARTAKAHINQKDHFGRTRGLFFIFKQGKNSIIKTETIIKRAIFSEMMSEKKP